MTDAPQILLHYHLKKLRLPTFVAECEKQAKQCATDNKTHIALGLGLVACQNCLKVRFINAAALVHELIEASDEKHLLRPLTPLGFPPELHPLLSQASGQDSLMSAGPS